MKIACAQINQVIGDFSGNLQRIETAVDHAELAGADLVVFPETVTCGPFPGDFLICDRFVRDNLELLDRLVIRAKKTGILLGYVRPCPRGNKLENAAALIADGQIVSTHVKTRLAVHGAFDESRYFEPGESIKPVDFRGARLGVTICEDIYRADYPGNRRSFPADPAADAVAHGAEIIINIAASPFTLENRAARHHALKECAAAHHRPVLFVNHVGGNDEWIFDGQSLALDSEGRRIACAESFEEDLLLVDMEVDGQDNADRLENDTESAVQALVLGTRDFVHKRGCQSVLLELSGDMNSAVAAAIAAAALGANNVHGVHLDLFPLESKAPIDISDLAACIGIRVDRCAFDTVALLQQKSAALFCRTEDREAVQHINFALHQMLLKSAADCGGHMLLSTDDKTDIYLKGPSLPLADFSMLSDIPKSLLWKASKQLGDMGIPPFRNISSKAPDASFLIPQTLWSAKVPLEQIDLILDHYMVQRFGAETIISLGFDAALTEQIVQMVKKTESRRRCAPVGLNVTTQVFGYYPHMPLCRQWKNC